MISIRVGQNVHEVDTRFRRSWLGQEEAAEEAAHRLRNIISSGMYVRTAWAPGRTALKKLFRIVVMRETRIVSGS